MLLPFLTEDAVKSKPDQAHISFANNHNIFLITIIVIAQIVISLESRPFALAFQNKMALFELRAADTTRLELARARMRARKQYYRRSGTERRDSVVVVLSARGTKNAFFENFILPEAVARCGRCVRLDDIRLICESISKGFQYNTENQSSQVFCKGN